MPGVQEVRDILIVDLKVRASYGVLQQALLDDVGCCFLVFNHFEEVIQGARDEASVLL